MVAKRIAKEQFFFKMIAMSIVFFMAATLVPLQAYSAIPNDPEYQRLKPFGNIALEQAWDIARGSRDVIVAVLDDGIDMMHADLKDNIWKNPDEKKDGVDNDGNGYVDDVAGWDFVDDDADPTPDKTKFDPLAIQHGTVVAGIIGAVGDNGVNSAGINWQVKIMNLRMLDSEGNGNTDYASQAINYAVKKGAHIINLSLVGDTASTRFREAIERAHQAGITVVGAAGNAGKNQTGKNLNIEPHYPSCFDSGVSDKSLVIGVASVDENDKLSVFSHYGSNCIDISAPGEHIPSTMYQSLDINQIRMYGGDWNGTSIATPMVSAAAALLKSINVKYTPADILRLLSAGVDSLQVANPSTWQDMGAGRLNIYKTLTIAMKESGAVAPTIIPSVVLSETSSSTAPATTPLTPAPGNSLQRGVRVVIAPQSNMKSVIQIYGSDGLLENQFTAFEETFTGGVTIATGDTDGDGVAEIIVGKGVGGEPRVKIFATDGTLKNEFLAGNASDPRGIPMGQGVRVAAVDVTRDGKVEIITVPLSGSAQFISVFTAQGKKLITFSPGERFYPFGIHMAAGMVAGKPRIVVSEQQGNDQKIEGWDQTGSFANHWTLMNIASQRPTLAMGDIDGDMVTDIVLGAAPGNQPLAHYRPFNSAKNAERSVLMFDEDVRSGINVAAAPGFIIAGTGKGITAQVAVSSVNGQSHLLIIPFGFLFRGGVVVAALP